MTKPKTETAVQQHRIVERFVAKGFSDKDALENLCRYHNRKPNREAGIVGNHVCVEITGSGLQVFKIGDEMEIASAE